MPTDVVSEDQPCSSGTVYMSSVSEFVNTSRCSEDSQESYFHAQAGNNLLFDMHCDLRYVLSDFSDSNADRYGADASGEICAIPVAYQFNTRSQMLLCLIF